jgi:DNA-binding PadR family transcriptional regulator
MMRKPKVPTLSQKEATILSVLLADPGREMYGLQILEESRGLLKRGTLYVTLQRMEEKRVLESKQEPRSRPEVGIPRRVYSVTGLGALAFDQYKEAHHTLSDLISVGAAVFAV